MITFNITWKHVFFDLPLTEEEYNHSSSRLIADSLRRKKGYRIFARNGKNKVLIPYSKLKKGIITFETIA